MFPISGWGSSAPVTSALKANEAQIVAVAFDVEMPEVSVAFRGASAMLCHCIRLGGGPITLIL